ncbi:MAG TPA: CHAD domain-containing protein [Acidimicrobiia bacterium]|nr:CHAD domain-containing protein [Acidimicrobiia bacterium]
MADVVTVADIVSYALARAYGKLCASEPGMLAGNDPEAIHDGRVATRRLRSDLRTFEPFLDRDWAQHLRGELQWLTAELGDVRDVEVMRERLGHHAQAFSASDADRVEHVLRRLDADREAARMVLLSGLRSARYAQVRSDLAAGVGAPPLRKRARRDARDELGDIVHERWRKLARDVKRLGPAPSDGDLHHARIRAKRCRYAAEACEPAFGKPARQFARVLANVQDVLGEQHDAVVAGAWLGKTAPECTPEDAYLLGRLAQVQEVAAAAARDEFLAMWPDVKRKQLRRWM